MSPISRPGFSYQPLTELDAIRLVLLHPAHDVTAQLECSLKHTTLRECDEDLVNHYTALSYVWGDPTDLRPIIVDGCVLKITANLDSALRHLRDRNGVMRIWADAICINQADLEERSRQVQRMGSVYSVARHTVIYLGDSNEKEKLAFSVLKSLCSGSFYFETRLDLQLDHISVDLGLTHEALEKQILTRPWFTRVWIFQELLLSRDPWIQCGSKRLRWSDFYQISVAVRDRVQGRLKNIAEPNFEDKSSTEAEGDLIANSPKRDKTMRCLEYMQAARQQFQGYLQGTDRGNTLISILAFRRGMGVSDPRDMIYAHLGLTSKWVSTDIGFVADYSKNLYQVFFEAAHFILSQKHQYYQYDLLAQVEDVDPASRHHNLPSWIPDWTLSEIQYQLTRDHHEPTEHWNSPPDFGFGMSSEGKYQLHCKGRIYGRVREIGKNVLRFAHISQDEIRQAWSPYVTLNQAGRRQEWYDAIQNATQRAVGLPEFSKYSKWHKEALGSEGPRLPGPHPVALALSKPFTASYSQPNLLALEDKRICQVGCNDPNTEPYWSEFALVPQWTKTGDIICSLHGDSRLFVFRPANKFEHPESDREGCRFFFIGVCYAARLYWQARSREAGVERMFTLE